MLYPNLTFTQRTNIDPVDANTNNTIVQTLSGFPLNANSTLLLGPLQVNNSFALISLTLPIINDTSKVDVLGFVT